LLYIAIAYDGDLKDAKFEFKPSGVNNLPAYIVPNDQITLDQLEIGSATVIENLPKECQVLYANVHGKNIKLDTEELEQFIFSGAIERSITHEDLLCYQTLKLKEGEFDSSKKEVHSSENQEPTRMVYLRITLGNNQGNSPGVPFVMEIWPSKCCSPIHKHSDAFAIIKVLHGEIRASFYPYLQSNQFPLSKPYLEAELIKDDITWISNEQYQTHKLANWSNSVCVTIQCYQYGKKDHAHYEYFDYLDDKGVQHKFTPNIDFTYGTFKSLIFNEWRNRNDPIRLFETQEGNIYFQGTHILYDITYTMRDKTCVFKNEDGKSITWNITDANQKTKTYEAKDKGDKNPIKSSSNYWVAFKGLKSDPKGAPIDGIHLYQYEL